MTTKDKDKPQEPVLGTGADRAQSAPVDVPEPTPSITPENAEKKDK